MSKRPVAYRVPRLLGDMVSHYFVTTSEDEARAMADTNQVEYEGLYLVGDRHTGDVAQSSQVTDADVSAIWSAVAFLRSISPGPNDIAGNNRRADDSFRLAADLEKIAKRAAQPPAAPVETERRCQKCGETTKGEEALVDDQIWCHPCADHPRSSAGRETELLATLVYEAMRFAIWAAGQGMMPDEGEPALGPEDFLYEYSCALEIDDWEGLAEVARDHIRAVPQQLSVSEEERHAIEHARYRVDQASIVNPDCCFDYDLVKDLIRALDRAYPLPRPHQP